MVTERMFETMEKKALTQEEIEQLIVSGTSLEDLLKQLNCSNVGEFKKLERSIISNKKMTTLLKLLKSNRKKVNYKIDSMEKTTEDNLKISESVLPKVLTSCNSSTTKISGNDDNIVNSDCDNTDNVNLHSDNMDSHGNNTDNVGSLGENMDNVDSHSENMDNVSSQSDNTNNIDSQGDNTDDVNSNTFSHKDENVTSESMNTNNTTNISNVDFGNNADTDIDVSSLEQDLAFYEGYANTLLQEMEKLQSNIVIQYNELTKRKKTLQEMLQQVEQEKKDLEKCMETCLVLKASQEKNIAEQHRVADIISTTKNEIEKHKQVYLVFLISDLQNTELIGRKILYDDECKKIVSSEFKKTFFEKIYNKQNQNLDKFKMSSLKKMAYIIAICNKYEGIKIVINDEDITELCKILQLDFVTSIS